MTLNEYQKLASRTINKELNSKENEYHALHGMVSEVGELHAIYQKVYQGHGFDLNHAVSEVGDLLWFVAEWCTAWGLSLEDVCQQNYKKLKKRYSEGFDVEHSLHRLENDI